MTETVRKPREQIWLQTILFAGGMVLAGLVSREVSFTSASVPTLWLPSGLYLAALLLSPIRHWLFFLLAALPAWLVYGWMVEQPVLLSLLFFFSGSLEAVTAAWLMRRFRDGLQTPPDLVDRPRPAFEEPSHVMNLLVFAVLLGSAISATINTSVLATLQPGLDFWPAWRIGWMGSGLGTLVLTPLVLSLAPLLLNRLRGVQPERLIELAILITGISISALYAFVRAFSLSQQNFNYIVIPFLVWAALRFGVVGVSLGGLIVTLTSLLGILQYLDGFTNSDIAIANTMDSLSSFLAITLLTNYILATVWSSSRRIQQALSESENRYRLLVENQGEGVSIVDRHEVFTFANAAAVQIFGLKGESLIGRKLRDFTTPQQYALVLEQTELRKQNQRSTYELEIIQPTGQRRSLLVTATPQHDSAGKFRGTFAVFRDITDRKQSEMALRDSRARLQTLFDHSPIPIWEEDFSRIKRFINGLQRDGVEDFREFFRGAPEQLEACTGLLRVLDVNQAVLQQFGFTSKEAFMAQLPELLRRGPGDIFLEELVAIAEGQTVFEMEGPNDEIDGLLHYHAVRWAVAPGYEKDYRRVIVSIIDISERIRAEERMRYLSTHDVLTGLYNRNFFEAELERMQHSRLEPINVMVVDVNKMKATNDSHGHAAGDDLLRRTAQVLKISFRKEDVIARVGGDEFVVLFQGSITPTDAIQRVRACLAEHNRWYDGLPLNLSIGAASGGTSSPLLDLYKKADAQMYRDKNRSRRQKPESKEDRDAAKAGDSPSTG